MEKSKKSKAFNDGLLWNDNTRDTLKILVDKGLPIKKIANIMGRTPESISYQKGVLKLYSPNGNKSIHSVVKSNVRNITRTEWTKDNLAILKSLGLTNKLNEAPKFFGCTENAARIKYGRMFGNRTDSPVYNKMHQKKQVVDAKPKVDNTIKVNVNPPTGATRDAARDITKSARDIARANGKRITMAMFFVEDI